MGIIEWCSSCSRWEEAREEETCCLECGHVYKTAQELVEAYNREADSINDAYDGPPPVTYMEKAEDVNFCPLCLHDF